MMLIALLAAATLAQPSEVRTFQDWSVACDNGLACEAVALLPENAEGDVQWEEWVTLTLRRGGGASDPPVLILQGYDGSPAALLADGHPLPVRFSESVDGMTVIGDERLLVETLRTAHVLEVRNAAGASLGRISLAGASAAMLYMDDKQHRLDTVTALVRRGSRPASAVPAPPAVPQIRMAPPPADEALTIDTAVVAGFRRRFDCDEYDTREDSEFETMQIATGTTLVLVPCGSGAYNFSSVPVIARRRGGRIVTELAPFDRQWGLRSEGHPVLINADWDPDERRLREFSKARGLGDCGSRADYAWDGASFRLVHQEDMEECRGSIHYVTTWRAEAVGR